MLRRLIYRTLVRTYDYERGESRYNWDAGPISRQQEIDRKAEETVKGPHWRKYEGERTY